MSSSAVTESPVRKPFYRELYIQAVIALVLGVFVGTLWPEFGVALKPLGDAFIKLIRMIIPLVIFCTVVSGIAGMQDTKKVGRVGAKAIIYFEIVSTLALVVGLVVGNVFQPGAGFNADLGKIDTKGIAEFTTKAKDQHVVDFLLNIIPNSAVDAFSSGSVLQVLFFAVLFGFALSALGSRGDGVRGGIDSLSQIIFRLLNIIMFTAPVATFGAMAFAIGRYGLAALIPLLKFMLILAITNALFIGLVFGGIARALGIRITRLIGYLKEELLLILGTGSTETALPQLIVKMERVGCARSVVGLVIPAGYSFNLDGTNIYMAMGAIFVAQATNTEITLLQELTLLGVAMLTSKGAAGVTGSGFVTLAATLAVVPSIPIEGMALILGIDRFMNMCRAMTNYSGNAIATIAVARWENEVDQTQLVAMLGPKVAAGK